MRDVSGGRSLNAIWRLKVDPYQKLILHYLASQMDFNKDFSEARWASLATLKTVTGIGRTKVVTALNGLVADGYLQRIHRFEHNGKKPTAYRFTDKMFLELPETTPTPSPRDGLPPSPPQVLPLVRETDYPSPPQVHRAPSGAPSLNSLNCETANAAAHMSQALESERSNRIDFKAEGKRLKHVKEAEGILMGLLDLQSGYVDTKAVKVTTRLLLEKHGIERLREFFQVISDQGQLASLPWVPSKFDAWLTERRAFERSE